MSCCLQAPPAASLASQLASAAVMTDCNGKINGMNRSAAAALGGHSMNGRMFVEHCVAPAFHVTAVRAIESAAHGADVTGCAWRLIECWSGEPAQAEVQLLIGSSRGLVSLVAIPRTQQG